MNLIGSQIHPKRQHNTMDHINCNKGLSKIYCKCLAYEKTQYLPSLWFCPLSDDSGEA